MRILLIGAPGAGKGTQAEKLSATFKIPRLTTGDLLRQAVQEQSSLGEKVQAILERGELVPDATILEVMAERMQKEDAAKGFILDGFPRTIGQALGLENWLKKNKSLLDSVIAIDITEEEAVLRITGRRQCGKCGKAYHLQFLPPQREGICDACNGSLIQRKDDREAVVRHRLKVYNEETAPLIEFYDKRRLLKHIDGAKDVNKVFNEICSLIK